MRHVGIGISKIIEWWRRRVSSIEPCLLIELKQNDLPKPDYKHLEKRKVTPGQRELVLENDYKFL